LGDIYHVDIQLDNAGEIHSNRSKRCLEIFKDLLCLGTEVLRTDDLPCSIKSNLTSKKDRPPPCDLNDMGIAWGRCQSGWINEASVGWMSCHYFPFS
jgi:hypothetical protein